MKYKFVLSSIILFCIFITLVSAEKTGTAVDIKIQCLNNNTYCSASAICNLTLLDNNNNAIVTNVKMTNQGSIHNYTLSPSQTLVQGQVTGSAVCYDGATYLDPAIIEFTLTPSGFVNTLGFTIIIFLIAYGILIFGFAIKNEWVAIAGGLACVSLGLFSINNGIADYRSTITDAISWWTIAVGAITSIYAGYSIIEDNI